MGNIPGKAWSQPDDDDLGSASGFNRSILPASFDDTEPLQHLRKSLNRATTRVIDFVNLNHKNKQLLATVDTSGYVSVWEFKFNGEKREKSNCCLLAKSRQAHSKWTKGDRMLILHDDIDACTFATVGRHPGAYRRSGIYIEVEWSFCDGVLKKLKERPVDRPLPLTPESAEYFASPFKQRVEIPDSSGKNRFAELSFSYTEKQYSLMVPDCNLFIELSIPRNKSVKQNAPANYEDFLLAEAIFHNSKNYVVLYCKYGPDVYRLIFVLPNLETKYTKVKRMKVTLMNGEKLEETGKYKCFTGNNTKCVYSVCASQSRDTLITIKDITNCFGGLSNFSEFSKLAWSQKFVEETAKYLLTHKDYDFSETDISCGRNTPIKAFPVFYQQFGGSKVVARRNTVSVLQKYEEVKHDVSEIIGRIKSDPIAEVRMMQYVKGSHANYSRLVELAVKTNGMALEFAHCSAQDNPWIAAIAHEQNSKAIRFASVRVQNNRCMHGYIQAREPRKSIHEYHRYLQSMKGNDYAYLFSYMNFGSILNLLKTGHEDMSKCLLVWGSTSEDIGHNTGGVNFKLYESVENLSDRLRGVGSLRNRGFDTLHFTFMVKVQRKYLEQTTSIGRLKREIIECWKMKDGDTAYMKKCEFGCICYYYDPFGSHPPADPGLYTFMSGKGLTFIRKMVKEANMSRGKTKLEKCDIDYKSKVEFQMYDAIKKGIKKEDLLKARTIDTNRRYLLMCAPPIVLIQHYADALHSGKIASGWLKPDEIDYIIDHGDVLVEIANTCIGIKLKHMKYMPTYQKEDRVMRRIVPQTMFYRIDAILKLIQHNTADRAKALKKRLQQAKENLKRSISIENNWG